MKTNTTITTTIYFVRNPDGSINTFATTQDVETFFLRLVLNGESTDGYTLYTATETPISVTRPRVTLGPSKTGRSGPKNRGPNGLPMTKDGREYRPGRRAGAPASTTTEELEATLPLSSPEPIDSAPVSDASPPLLPPRDFDTPSAPRFVADDAGDSESTPPPSGPKGRTHRRAVVA